VVKGKWKVVRKTYRKLGPVWVVTRNKNGKKHKGYFKFPTRKTRKYTGPLLANELISYRLARELHLKVAKIRRAKIQGKRGVVSLVRPALRHYHWSEFSKKVSKPIIDHIDKPERLLKTFVFDIWICNVDRHGNNLITYRKGNKYSFYLIDHGLTLLGAIKWGGLPWYSSLWDDVARYNQHYVQGLRSYIYSYRQLSPFVEQIQRIPEYRIRKIVESLPASILSHHEKKIVIKLLLYRQWHLHFIVQRWVDWNRNRRQFL
jgi:hypothetical protein